jgi:hypothetical protein
MDPIRHGMRHAPWALNYALNSHAKSSLGSFKYRLEIFRSHRVLMLSELPGGERCVDERRNPAVDLTGIAGRLALCTTNFSPLAWSKNSTVSRYVLVSDSRLLS